MPDLPPQELIRAEELIDNGKIDEGLEIITNFEKNNKIIPKEQIWTQLLRGRVHVYSQQFKEGVEIGERVYKLSKELGMVFETIDALILKAQIAFLGRLDEALKLILKAEKRFNSLSDESSIRLAKGKTIIT
ncbi:MAG: tetratricopeptide repeat protein, partial [Promethearchaeota archaeon]